MPSCRSQQDQRTAAEGAMLAAAAAGSVGETEPAAPDLPYSAAADEEPAVDEPDLAETTANVQGRFGNPAIVKNVAAVATAAAAAARVPTTH